MAQGRVDLARLVTHKFPLSAYKEAFHTAMDKGRSGVLKAVFYPD
jgi:threonine dehydrogenase-like Zn-dependent dehydrogenase